MIFAGKSLQNGCVDGKMIDRAKNVTPKVWILSKKSDLLSEKWEVIGDRHSTMVEHTLW